MALPFRHASDGAGQRNLKITEPFYLRPFEVANVLLVDAVYVAFYVILLLILLWVVARLMRDRTLRESSAATGQEAKSPEDGTESASLPVREEPD